MRGETQRPKTRTTRAANGGSHQSRITGHEPLPTEFSGDLAAEIFVGEAQALFEINFGLPLEDAAGFGDVGAALPGIVLGERAEDDGSRRAGERAYALGEF